MKLDALVEPVTRADFLRDHWERAPLHLGNRPADRFDHLLSAATLEQVLFYSRPRPPDLRVIAEQRELPLASYAAADGGLNLNALYKAFDEGHTFVVNGIERFHPPLAALRRDLEGDLDFQVVTNAYFSPAGSRGLYAHFDTHDVFVLQLEGEKEWLLYGPGEELPLLAAFQPVFDDASLGPPEQRLTLKPGDVLYVPRGWTHQAHTLGRHSLHLTVGIYPTQWVDLLIEALTLMASANPQLRRALPVGYLGNPAMRAGMTETAADLVRQFGSRAGNEDLLDLVVAHLGDRFTKQAWAAPDGHLRTVVDLPKQLRLDTVLTKRAGMRCRVIHEADHVSLRFPGNTFRSTAEYRDALVWIALREQPFVPRELPGDIDDGRRLTLAWRLVRAGLITTGREGS